MKISDVRPRLKRTIGFAIAMVALFTIFTIFLIHYALNSQEQLYIDVSNNVVQRLQTVKQEQLIEINNDIAWQTVTVQFVLTNDTAWADNYIRDYLIDSLDHDLAIIAGPNDVIKYMASSSPEFSEQWVTRLIQAGLGPLLNTARTSNTRYPDTQFGYVMVDEHLFMVAVTLITPYIKSRQSWTYQQDHLLITARIIDDVYARLLGVFLDLKNATLSDCATDSATQLIIADPDGNCLRRITWSITSSKYLYQGLITIFVVFLLLLVGLAFVLLRSLYQLIQQFAEHANVDDMTGLYNRRYFNVVASDEMSRFCRGESIGIFMLLDIDKFKQLNDVYGHQAGDEALKRVGQTIKTVFRRDNDFAFRLGGEEFGVIALVRESSEVKVVSEKILHAIESLNIENKDNVPYGMLTVSIGVYTSESSDSSCNLEQAYSKADQALYAAKNNGRNRIEYYKDKPA